jgi:hypothetical protein
MTLSSYSIANLIQGISQQPDSQRDPTQGELQVNGYSSLADGLRKRAGTSVIRQISSTSLGDVFFHSILRDSGEKYLVVIGRFAIRVFDLDGIEKTVSAPFGYSYLFTVINCATDIRAATIADYTFVSSVKRVPAMSAALAPATARPAANEALVWVRAANYGQTYRVSVNGTLATVTTPVQPVTTSGSTVTENRISTDGIAESIKTALAGVSGVTIAREGSVLHVTSSNAITVAVTDARANADITAITNTVQAFTDLPTIAPKGYQVEIVGDPSNQYDGYFVAFVPRGASATFGEGTWQECVAPGMPYQLDALTMPQLLVRLSNGTFYFGPANGSTQSGTRIPSWGQRTAGDFDTAPDPSFIGYPIQDVFVHRNRLGLLADENVILSRAKAFFDFFPETVSRVLDTDPIDLSASSNRVSVLRYAVPIQDEVILFSDQLQFRLSSDAAGLTPASATVSVLTAFEADMSVKPLQVASGIVFAQSNGSWSQFREFSIRSAGAALTGSAPSLTDHVPTFIPSGTMQLASNDAAGVWFAISNKPPESSSSPVGLYAFVNTPLPPGNLPTYPDGPHLLGYKFSTDVDCAIEQIGVYNTSPANNSLGIWNFTDDPFTPVFHTVLTGTGNCTSDGFCWRSAATFTNLPTITRNKIYVIAVAWSGPVPAFIESNEITLPSLGFGHSLGSNAYSADELPSLSADLTDYPPVESLLVWKKSFLNTNLVLRALS